MSKLMKYLLPGSLVLALLLVVVVAVQPLTSVEAQEDNTAVIERRDVNIIVDGNGVIQPERMLSLAFGVPGTVETVAVEIGNTVTAGQVLATINTEDLQVQVTVAEQALIAQQSNYNNVTEPPSELELAQANASIALAQSNLASAVLGLDGMAAQEIANCATLASATDALEMVQEAYDDYVRAGYEADPNFIPDSDSQAGKALRDAQNNYDITTAQCSLSRLQSENNAGVEAARANLAQAEAAHAALLAGPTENQINGLAAQVRTAELQLEQAQSRLEDAQIVAPFAGIITEVNIIEGQTVGTQMLAITVADISQLHIDVRVDELDIANIAPGQQAEIFLDAIEDRAFTGTVNTISPAGVVLQGIVTYGVEVGVNDSDDAIRLGMTADVEIQVSVLEGALTVPRSAIHRNNDLGEYLVIQTESGTQDVAVTPGYGVDGWIVVEGDISEGQTVLLNTEN